MKRWFAAVSVVGLFVGGLWLLGDAAGPAPAEEAAAKKISAVVLVGGHDYDVKEFQELFRGFDDLDAAQPSQKDGAALFDNIDGWKYDTIVLYNFAQKIPEKQQENFLKLMDKGVGLFVLHHALAAYPDWPEFATIAGVRYFLQDAEVNGVKYPRCGWKHDVDFKIHVEDSAHPITKGLADYDVHDETYCGYLVAPKVHLLLTTDEKTSGKAVAWCHLYRKSRVFALQSGHDAKAYANKNFRTIVGQGLRWTVGRLPEGDLKPTGPAPNQPK